MSSKEKRPATPRPTRCAACCSRCSPSGSSSPSVGRRRTLPVYEFVVADAGLKIAPMKEGECIPAEGDTLGFDRSRGAPLPLWRFQETSAEPVPETRPRPRWPRVDRIEAGGVSMSALIDSHLGRARPRRRRQDWLHGAVQSAPRLCCFDAAGIPFHFVRSFDLRGVGGPTGFAAATRRGTAGCARDRERRTAL